MMTNDITIKIVKHENQAYPTVGNYTTQKDGSVLFEISDTGNFFMNRLILLHELVEQTLCDYLGIKEEDITNFDLYFEKKREQGFVPDNAEPGHDDNAPYRQAHLLAEAIEMQVAAFAGISWKNYEQIINSL